MIYDKLISPKSEDYYDKYYTKLELIKMYRRLIMDNNHVVRSRRSLKAIITRLSQKSNNTKK